MKETDRTQSDNSRTQSSYDNDKEAALQVLTQISQVNPSNITNLLRLGKSPAGNNKDRPLLVCLDSENLASTILRNKCRYKSNVYINNDRTINQRNHLINLKKELANLIDNGHKKKIKFINNVPTIVDDMDDSRRLHQHLPATVNNSRFNQSNLINRAKN